MLKKYSRPLAIFAGKCLLLLAILVVADRLCGWGLSQLFFRQTHGDDSVTQYLLKDAREEIIILGASRASHHYDCRRIEAATGLSCFNGGRDNMPIQYAAAVLNIVYEHAHPKTVILDVIPTGLWPSQQADDALKQVLLPFSVKYPTLADVICRKDQLERYKIKLSSIYPFNSTVGTAFQNTFTHMGHESIKGYEPLNSAIDPRYYKEPIWGNFTAGRQDLDTFCVQALKDIIMLTKKHNTRLIAIISPFYFPIAFKENNSFIAIRDILKEHGCELYDFSHDPRFLMQPQFFQDDIHLNDSGAALFDESVISILNNKGAISQL